MPTYPKETDRELEINRAIRRVKLSHVKHSCPYNPGTPEKVAVLLLRYEMLDSGKIADGLFFEGDATGE